MQEKLAQSLVREVPICHGATKPMNHNYPVYRLQLLTFTCVEPVLCNKKSHWNEKPVHCS